MKRSLSWILTQKVFELLEDAWGVHSSKYSVMIGTQDYNGAIQNYRQY